MNLPDIILGFLIAACIRGIAATVSEVRHKHKTLKEIQDAHTKGYLAGLNTGVAYHAIWMNRSYGSRLHGFALTCASCRQIFGAVEHSSSEYTHCPYCKHRQPAPLATSCLKTEH